MTEQTPKKPRRKRRTKAQIEAEKAAQASKEVKTDDVIVEMLEKSVLEPEVAKEEPVVSAEPTVSEEPKLSPYQQAKRDARKSGSPVTYANPDGEYIPNRYKRERAERKNKL